MRFSKLWSRLKGRGKKGSVTAIMAAGMPMMFLAAGVPIDLGRQIELRTALQNAVDEATISAATLLSEGNASSDIPAMVNAYIAAATNGVNATIQPASVSVTSSSVTVTVSASLGTTLTRLIGQSMSVSVSSTAVGPGSTFTVTATPVATGAADLNTVYLYAMNPDGSKDTSHRTELVDNNGTTYPAGKAVTVSMTMYANQRIAFEMDNKTGGRNANFYPAQNPPTNAYGSRTGTVNVFYSSDYPASLNTTNSVDGYSAIYQENIVNTGHVYFQSQALACYVGNGHPVTFASYNTTTNKGTLTSSAQQQNVLVNGGCANLTQGSPQNIAPTCLELNGQSFTVQWNDMGDTYNDNDSDVYNAPYADMTYSFSCVGSGNTYTAVALTK